MTNKYQTLYNEEGRFTPEAAKIIRRYLMGSPVYSNLCFIQQGYRTIQGNSILPRQIS